MIKTNSTVSRDEAETLAISALGFLAADKNHLDRFLSLTGIDPASIRQLAKTPAFMASVLEYLLADESLLLVFCANAGIGPEKVAPAARLLAGGDRADGP